MHRSKVKNATRVLVKLALLSSCYNCTSNTAASFSPGSYFSFHQEIYSSSIVFSWNYQKCSKSRATSHRLHLSSADGDDESPVQIMGSQKENKKRVIIRPRRPASLVARETIQRKQEEEEALEKMRQARLDPTLLSSTTFAERSDIHPSTKRAITQLLRLEQMTEIQAKTFHPIMQGLDVLGRARTGSGKTLAFLIPSIQRWMDLPSSTITPTTSTTAAVAILILVPTRELCIQISEQAKILLTFHNEKMMSNGNKRLTVGTMYGGTTLRSDMTYLNSNPFTVKDNYSNRYNNNKINNNNHLLLIATPGRLLDHLQNTKLQGGKKFSDIMTTLQILILDESDRLLVDLREEVRKVISYLPKKPRRHNQQPRQTLLFSATLPPLLIKGVAAEILNPNYITVDCCTSNFNSTMDGRMAEHANRKANFTTTPPFRFKVEQKKTNHVMMETNVRVQQSYIILPSTEIYVASVIQVIQAAVTPSKGEKKNTSYNKVIAFFPTAWITSFFAYIFQEILPHNIPIFELHSRKRQGFRSKTRDAFTQASQGILFTSDVSARGVDYPDVTHVLQFGMSSSRDTYIHRLGRTGRAGKEGKGWLILSPFEASFLKELKGLDLSENQVLNELLHHIFLNITTASTPDEMKSSTDHSLLKIMALASNTRNSLLLMRATMAYQSFLGYYHENMKRCQIQSGKQLLQLADSMFSYQVGLRQKNMPKITRRLASRLNLVGIPGIRIIDSEEES